MISSHSVVLIVSTFLYFVTSSDLNYSIEEEIKPDTKIGNVVNDSGLLDPTIIGVEYRILTQGNEFAKYFRIDNKTGNIFTAEVLDRESLSSCEFSDICKLPLEIIAQSPGGTYFKKVGVQFIIKDINDNIPKFPSNWTKIEILESSVIGYTLPIEGAIDLDIGINSVQKYEVIPSNTPFSVEFDSDGSPSIKLKLKANVDRETQDFYNFQILAIDGGSSPKTGSLYVVAEIMDINDNKPQFSQPVFNITIDEDLMANTVILNISAVDPDDGINGEVTYRLSPYQSEEIRNMFAIDKLLGNLTIVKSLTYQPGETLKIIIEASDNAVQPLISQAIVFARVLDSTNDAPEIHANLLSSPTRASIAENATIGAAVAHIKVTDDDLGMNGYVNCSVTEGNKFFKLKKLDTNEYTVVVSASLDREKIDLHDVTVTCHDFGVPSLSATNSFSVEVLDVNEEPPKFIQNTFRVKVKENNSIGAEIATVSAIDSDSGLNAKVRYSLQQTGKYKFVIDSASGKIRANFILDRETTQEITFKVAAADSGIEPKTGLATVIVTILDTNDNKPIFSEPYFTFSVPENQPIYSFVGRISASDVDLGQNGVVRFMQTDSTLPFLMTQNGSIYTKEILDREQHPHGITFNALAYDLGQPVRQNNSVFVTVHLLDQNDNAPILIFPNEVNRTISMVYDLPKNTVIGRIEAEDRDYSVNANLAYYLHERSAQFMFRVDSETGEIRTAKKFELQDVNRYAFTVIVEDRGVPKLSVNHTLTVVIISNIYEPQLALKTEEGDNYLLIAVIISCVTVVLAGIIILVIFLLRRIDLKKREHEHASMQEHQSNTPKPDLYDALDASQKENKVKSEKRVSFSESLDSINTPIERPAFKMSASKDKIEELLEKISTPPTSRETHVRSLASGTHPIRHNPKSQLEKMKLQTELLQLHTSRMNSMIKLQDDNDSETSIESNTSDSGRGGSESDIHSNAGHLQDIDITRRNYTMEENSHNRVRFPNSAINLQDIKPKFSTSSLQKSEYKVPRPSNYENYDVKQSAPSLGHLRPYHYFPFKNDRDLYQRNSIVSESVATYDEYDNASTTTSGSYTVDDLDGDFRYKSDVIV